MPGKGRRVASRQAQLGQRRRRQVRGPSEVAGPTVNAVPESSEEAGVSTAVKEPQAQAAESRTARTSPVAAERAAAGLSRRLGRSRSDQQVVYSHIGPEIKRILLFAGILLVVLIVLSFII